MSRLSVVSHWHYLLFTFVLIFVVSACSSTDEAGSQDATVQATNADTQVNSGPPIGLDPTETVPAPGYREPVEPITLDNVARIEYLGRLDASGRKSTIFNWAISPDGTQLVAVNNDLLLEWNIVTGELNFNTTRRDVTTVLYSPDKSEIYGINVNGIALIYRSITGQELTTIKLHDNYSGFIDYNDLNGLLAVAGTDGTVKVWDVQERLSLVTFDAHEDAIVAVALSPDGKLLATTGVSGIIKIWDWESKTKTSEYDLQNAIADDMVFSPDGTQLAVATPNFVALWDVIAGKLDFVLQSGTDTANEVLKFSPDGRLLATAGEKGNMRLWDTETSNLEIELPDIGGTRVAGVFSPDSTLLVTTLLGHDASLWNLTDITEKTVGRAPLAVVSNNLFSVEWSSDGYTLLFFDSTGEIYVWGIPAGD